MGENDRGDLTRAESDAGGPRVVWLIAGAVVGFGFGSVRFGLVWFGLVVVVFAEAHSYDPAP